MYVLPWNVGDSFNCYRGVWVLSCKGGRGGHAGGYTYPIRAKRTDEACPVQGHKTGTDRSGVGPFARLPISASLQQISGNPRLGSGQSKEGDFCAWVLLASAPRMSEGLDP